MTKIIKPLLDENGCHIKRPIKVGEYYYSLLEDDYVLCKTKGRTLNYHIYYEEKWKPKEDEFYWFYCFSFSNPVCTVFNSSNIYDDTKRLSLGNCFQTKEEAEDINNILKVLDNMKKYYQDKQQEGK